MGAGPIVADPTPLQPCSNPFRGSAERRKTHRQTNRLLHAPQFSVSFPESRYTKCCVSVSTGFTLRADFQRLTARAVWTSSRFCDYMRPRGNRAALGAKVISIVLSFTGRLPCYVGLSDFLLSR